MKFAQYLEENCTPEWKRCYLDYRRLKKQIKLISARHAQESGQPASGDSDNNDHGGHGLRNDSMFSVGTGITIPPSVKSRRGTGMSGNSRGRERSRDLVVGNQSAMNGNGNESGFDSVFASDGGEAEAGPSNPRLRQSRGSGQGQNPAQGPERDYESERSSAHSQGHDHDSSSEDGDAGPHAPFHPNKSRTKSKSNAKGLSSSYTSPFRRASMFRNPFGAAAAGAGAGGIIGKGKETEKGVGRGRTVSILPTIEGSPWIDANAASEGRITDSPRQEDQQPNSASPLSIPTTPRSRYSTSQNLRHPLSSSLPLPNPSSPPRQYGSLGTSPRQRYSPRFVESRSPRERGGRVSPPPPLRLPEATEEEVGDVEDQDLRTYEGASAGSGVEESSRSSDKEKKLADPSRKEEGAQYVDRPISAQGDMPTPSSTIETNRGGSISASSGPEGPPSDTPILSKPQPAQLWHSPHQRSQTHTKSPRLLAIGKSPKLQAWMSGGGGTGTSPERGMATLRKMTENYESKETADGVRYPHNLDELYDLCFPDERKFFVILDGELEKVEGFYHEREADALKRAAELKRQLAELAEHRRVFHEAEKRGDPKALSALLPESRRIWNGVEKKMWTARMDGPTSKPTPTTGRLLESVKPGESKTMKRPKKPKSADRAAGRSEGPKKEGDEHALRRRIGQSEDGYGDLIDPIDPKSSHRMDDFDPDKYQRYKKSLRAAALEFYKELEILKNYRILNLTGFKKALKKFEKVAGLRSLDLYMDGKVAKRSFASGTKVDKLLKQVEEEFTIHFEKGDHKKAVGRLRGQFITKTHHFSAFWSGIYIGVGLPGMILGLTSALSAETQVRLPQYDGLLQVYAVFFLPVLFGMLFELNLLAYVSSRINYTFIMEIDSRTAIDHRQFMEIPALLFAVLAWCFMFTMYGIGQPHITPFAWPIVWLVFTCAFFLNPIPVYYQHARYWLISVLARTLTPGYSRVEFIAFFVADELNSLIYSTSGLWFVGCAYNKGWPYDTNIYDVCGTNHNWVYGALLCLPAFIRLVQCLKRYRDSSLNIHLINAGKYAVGIMQYGAFLYWRSRGSFIHDRSFPLWASVATIYSIYASSWDLMIDWGLLRPRYGYLRESLGYPSRWLYYFAMVSNVLIRFVWVFYIPSSTTKVRLRSFIFATMEMLRRWQWNFFRVETEQMGNTDQYRITREIPLPYQQLRDDEDDDQLKRVLSRKAGTFGLQSAAIKLGELREKVTKRDRSDGPPRRVGFDDETEGRNKLDDPGVAGYKASRSDEESR